MYQFKMLFKFIYIFYNGAKSGRCGHRPRRCSAVGVHTSVVGVHTSAVGVHTSAVGVHTSAVGVHTNRKPTPTANPHQPQYGKPKLSS